MIRACLILLLAVTLNATAADPHVWGPWEQSLTSSKTYSNPYREGAVTVTFNGPGGTTFQAPGFWDGGATYRIRCAFPKTGSWSWSTNCADTTNAGLHNKTGNVNVIPYTGSNPLFQRGLPTSGLNTRYLKYNDGTPFLWTGDTAWIAPLRATQAQWQTYVDDRATKHFTVIQISPASDWGGTTDRAGNAPFTGGGLTQWNPAYWQGFDQKVQYANQKGLLVLVVGVMEPTFRYPSSTDAQVFARNIVGRLHGSHVIFSPSFDSPYLALGDDVGNALNAATSQYRITQHTGTSLSAAQSYYDKSYMDFCSYQSGHNNGVRAACAKNAREWGLALYNRSPYLPVINLEAFYDSNGTTAGMAAKYLGTAKDARSLGYISWLSGAKGYTYGAYGLWNWEANSSQPYYWQTAMSYPSSTQIKYLHDFFAAIGWWRLEPDHSRIKNQSTDDLKKMTLAVSSNRDLCVAYLPDNASVQIDTAGFPALVTGRWYNPVSGQYTSIAGSLATGGTLTFNPPAAGDWVLLLQGTATGTNQPPSVALTSPTNGANFANGVTIALSATASDTDGTVAKVEFFADGSKLGEDTSAPYAFNWNGASGGSHALTARATDNGGAPTTSATVTITVAQPGTTGPIALWTFNEASGNIAQDTSGIGTAAPGTLLNGTARTAGRVDSGALAFDGVDDYVDVGNPVKLKLTGGMTLAAWVYIDTFTSSGRIISKQGANGDRGWTLNVESNGVGSFQIATNATTVIAANSTALQSGRWVHLAGVYEPGVMVGVYVDGVLNSAQTDGIPLSQRDSSLNVNIGRRPTVGLYWDGTIDDLRVYDRPLSGAEIQALVQIPAPPLVTLQQVSTGKTYQFAVAQAGALIYTDRSYALSSVSQALTGGVLIRQANDDKNVTTNPHITFTAGAPVRVYIGYDKRATQTPAWLNDGSWALTGESIVSADAGASPMRVYAKDFSAGTGTLGGNAQPPATGAASNYVPVVVGNSATPVPPQAARRSHDAWQHASDSDGDGLFDAYEQAAGLDPILFDSNANGTPDEGEWSTDAGLTHFDLQIRLFGAASEPSPRPMAIQSFSGRAWEAGSRDSLTLQGVLPDSGALALPGVTVSVYVAGVRLTFVLGKSGKATTREGVLKLQPSTGRLSLRLANGKWAETWCRSGALDANEWPVVIATGHGIYAARVSTKGKARAGFIQFSK